MVLRAQISANALQIEPRLPKTKNQLEGKRPASPPSLRRTLTLSDEEWAVISGLLPKQWRGPKRKDDRQILNGIFYILRTGAKDCN